MYDISKETLYANHRVKMKHTSFGLKSLKGLILRNKVASIGAETKQIHNAFCQR